MTDYTMPVLSEKEREAVKNEAVKLLSALRPGSYGYHMAQVALAALTAKPAFWNIYHHNTDTCAEDNKLYAECGPESGARAIANSIGGWVEPVYYGAPPVPVKQEGEQ